MRTRIAALLLSASVCASPIPLLAQNINEILNQLQGMAQSEIAKRAEAEWSRLQQSERGCMNDKLRERGDSVQSLTRRGILPSDARVAELRSQCRGSGQPAVQDQSTAAKPSAPPSDGPAVQQPAATPQAPAQATSRESTPTQPAQAASTSQPAELRQQADQPGSEATLYDLRRANERLQADLTASAIRIAELEKTRGELERAVKAAERARFDIENEKGVLEETRIADKRKFDAALARLDADKADAIDKRHTWELLAYSLSCALLVLLAVMASVRFVRWKNVPQGQQK